MAQKGATKTAKAKGRKLDDKWKRLKNGLLKCPKGHTRKQPIGNLAGRGELICDFCGEAYPT